MSEPGWLAAQFELFRSRLASAAYGMLGSVSEAEDAVQRRAVGAFLAAARDGDFETLLRVLGPGVVLRFDLGPGREALSTLAGAEAVARDVLRTAPRFIARARPVVVNGAAGAMFASPETLSRCSASPWPTAGSPNYTWSPIRPSCGSWPSSRDEPAEPCELVLFFAHGVSRG